MTQFFAIVRYEFLVHWRQRGLKVMAIALLLMQGFILGMAVHDPESGSILNLWSITAGFLMALIPFVVADTIPRDRQVGVDQVLGSLPLGPWTYLLGKVVGAWLAVASAVFPLTLLCGILWQLLVHPLSWGLFFSFTLLGATTLLLLNCGLTVLAAASQPSVIWALVTAIVVLVVVPVLLMNLFPLDSWATLVNPLRLPIFFYYLPLPEEAFDPTRVILFGRTLTKSASFASSAGIGLLELVGLALAARYWGPLGRGERRSKSQ